MTFGLLDHGCHLNLAGKEFSGPAIFNFNDPNGFDVVSGSEFSGISISLDQANLRRIARQLEIQESELFNFKQPIRTFGNISLVAPNFRKSSW